jgi:hypothetical protein
MPARLARGGLVLAHALQVIPRADDRGGVITRLTEHRLRDLGSNHAVARHREAVHRDRDADRRIGLPGTDQGGRNSERQHWPPATVSDHRP